MKYFLLIAFMLLTLAGKSQSIEGKWTGNYSRNFWATQPQRLEVELILYNDSLISGASHLYYEGGKYEHYKLKGVYHKKDSTVYFSEDSTLSVYLGAFADNCLGNYLMKLIITDTSIRLAGRWKDNSKSLIRCPTTKVWLEQPRKKQQKQTTPKPKDKKLERTPDIQSIIELASSEQDSIKIEVYDNAQIDGDVISVFVDDKEVITKRKIDAKPIPFYVSLHKHEPILKIKMVAESLGSIPPCTAHMIITTKEKRYELDLVSDFDGNGIVELFLKN